MGIYLDYNSSAPIDQRVLDAMINVYKNIIGNADSRTHNYGEKARQAVETSRGYVASLLDIKNDEVFFTSGATESNNIAIQGLKTYAETSGKKHIITTAIEHKSVLETVKAMQNQGFDVDFVKPDFSGRIDADEVINMVRDDTLLVSVMHVNNETGIIQPVREIGNALDQKDIFFHVDATQSFGKLIDELRELKYDMLSMSAHKINGPQGVGALILRKKRYKLPPVKSIVYGGQQEHGIRPGTIPVALTVGLGTACKIAMDEWKNNNETIKTVKEELVSLLERSGLKYSFNGDQKYCVFSTMNICIEGVSSEALMLSSKDYCGISNGSACNSNSYEPSYVLTAMGIAPERIENSVRISWGANIDLSSLKESFSEMLNVAKSLVW